MEERVENVILREQEGLRLLEVGEEFGKLPILRSVLVDWLFFKHRLPRLRWSTRGVLAIEWP